MLVATPRQEQEPWILRAEESGHQQKGHDEALVADVQGMMANSEQTISFCEGEADTQQLVKAEPECDEDAHVSPRGEAKSQGNADVVRLGSVCSLPTIAEESSLGELVPLTKAGTVQNTKNV